MRNDVRIMPQKSCRNNETTRCGVAVAVTHPSANYQYNANAATRTAGRCRSRACFCRLRFFPCSPVQFLGSSTSSPENRLGMTWEPVNDSILRCVRAPRQGLPKPRGKGPPTLACCCDSGKMPNFTLKTIKGHAKQKSQHQSRMAKLPKLTARTCEEFYSYCSSIKRSLLGVA